MVSADASAAFFQFPLSPEEMSKSCFSVPTQEGKRQYFAFTGPPFGATQVPRVFQALMGALRNVFNTLGFPSILYIDDLVSQLCREANKQYKMQFAEWYYAMLTNFGIKFNHKSEFTPSDTFQYLGCYVSLPEQLIVPVEGRIDRLFENISKLLSSTSVTLNELQILIGRLQSLTTSNLTVFVLRQLAFLTHKLDSAQGKTDIEIPSHIKEVVLLWIYRTPHFEFQKYTSQFRLDQYTVALKSTVVVVSDASEFEVGGFVPKTEVLLTVAEPVTDHILKSWSVPLPIEYLNTSPVSRELFGILTGLQLALTQHQFDGKKSISIFCDCLPAVFCLISGRSHETRSMNLVRDIHLLLLDTHKPFQFVWKRRDHRLIVPADEFSKTYYRQNPLRARFIRLFPHFEEYHLVPLHKAFKVTPGLTNLKLLLNLTRVNFLVLPYHSSLLRFWIEFLNENPKIRFIAVVPPIYTAGVVTSFVKKYSWSQKLYRKILRNPRFLVTSSAFLCKNFSGFT